ncbi:hypothetical protein [Pseudonocardia sp. H11422]|uniref:hypothetical protein n=1 Tax=Pseudonocardia sp. H11422 TaxID=2835866 RepID=UPI0027E283D5|nr:hypothetical protein [Pseudonocardia sp. H11422]
MSPTTAEPSPVAKTTGTAGSQRLAPDRGPDLAEQVAAVVTAHPAVARLDAGAFGAVATYLPGRRLAGVRIGEVGEPVELGVVLYLDRPFPEVVRLLRREVAALCGGAPVDITVTDVDTTGSPAGGP